MLTSLPESGDSRVLRAFAARYCVCVLTLAAVMLAGCATTSEEVDYDPVVARFYLETNAESRRAQTLELPVSETKVPVDPRVVISEVDVEGVEMVRVDLGMCLMFVMREDRVRSLTVLTSSNLGRRLILTLNGKPVGARTIDSPIQDGRLFTFVEIPDAELGATTLNLQKTTADVQKALKKSGRR